MVDLAAPPPFLLPTISKPVARSASCSNTNRLFLPIQIEAYGPHQIELC